MNRALNLLKIKSRLQALANRDAAQILQGFFKTGPGEYGEGDVFIGIKIPPLRALSKECENVSFSVIKSLLRSKVHEERTLALMVLVQRFEKADEELREQIYKFYLSHVKFINNWDLVDGSAPYIVGPFFWKRDRRQLYVFAKSSSLWERRIAILSTFYFIRQNDFADALKISEVLLEDEHDLIHKAVGWMLREIGKRDLSIEETFLRKHCGKMPRTMLRYAIERFPEGSRRRFLSGEI
jgi:3-methyladenine DNA glycosylase AlkD